MYDFIQPQSLQEAVQKLGSANNVKILAGGTDLIIALNNKTCACDCLLDCKKIPELQVMEMNSEGLSIGAAVPVGEIIASAHTDSDYKILRDSALTLANVLLRNRATLVGNICNSSPGGDMLPVCLVLDGWLETISPRGRRQIPLKDFFLGVKKNVLEADELVIKVVFPPKKGQGMYLKKRRIRGHDLAQISVAGYYSEDGTLKLSFGAAAPVPVLLDTLGVFTKSQLLENKQKIIDLSLENVSPISDVRSSKEYRIDMLRYFVSQIIDTFAKQSEEVDAL